MEISLRRVTFGGRLIFQRFAGGGGKPGKRATFNWKERRILGLDRPRSPTFAEVIRPYGNFDDISEFFNEKEGDMMIELSAQEDFDPPVVQEIAYNDKKKINMSALFGPSKPYGPLLHTKKEKFERKYRKKSVSGVEQVL